jgi:hypothetical protein
MSSKLSVEEVLSTLEQRAAFHREQEALHAQQEVHHREQRAFHAAELEKVLQNLEAFRTVAAAAVDLARPLAPKSAAVAEDEEASLPPPGRLQVSRFLQLAVERLEEPFGPTAVAAEANRRFGSRLRKPISPRTASDTLRRMLREGAIQLVRKGKASHEALYRRSGRRAER